MSLREREIVILRTCARCGAEYEWGVHVEVFAERADLSNEQVTALTFGVNTSDEWTTRENLLIQMVDALVATRDLPDELWAEMTGGFSDVELLDVIVLCGWYQAISQLCRAVQVDLEASAPRFGDFRLTPNGTDGCDIGVPPAKCCSSNLPLPKSSSASLALAKRAHVYESKEPCPPLQMNERFPRSIEPTTSGWCSAYWPSVN